MWHAILLVDIGIIARFVVVTTSLGLPTLFASNVREHGLKLFFGHTLSLSNKSVVIRFLVDENLRSHFQLAIMLVANGSGTDAVVAKVDGRHKHVRSTF
jgi:hypothetical protein